jgi:hypothetical protein
VGEKGVVVFLELGFDDFRDIGDIKIIVGSVVGPWSIDNNSEYILWMGNTGCC